MERFKIELYGQDVSLLEEYKSKIKENFPGFKIIHKRFVRVGSVPGDEPLFELDIRVQSMNHFWAISQWMQRISLNKLTNH